MLREIVGISLDIRNLVIPIDGAIVVQPCCHWRSPLVSDGARGTGDDPAFKILYPGRDSGQAGIPEAIVMQGKIGSIQAAVRADTCNVVVIAGATDEDAVPGNRGIGADPLGSNVSPRALAIAVWLVHRLEIHQAVAAVFAGDGIPHGPESRHILDRAGMGDALPITQNDLESLRGGRVNRSSVGTPEGAIHGVRIDRQSYGVRAQIIREPANDCCGFRIGCSIAV